MFHKGIEHGPSHVVVMFHLNVIRSTLIYWYHAHVERKEVCRSECICMKLIIVDAQNRESLLLQARYSLIIF